MGAFVDLNLPTTLDTSSADIIQDFFVPVLAHATRYDRGVGFFSSSWIRLAAQGLMALAQNHGQARWITSPILDKSDWAAMWEGTQARQDAVLRVSLFRSIETLAQDLKKDTRSALAWMVADGILDFRLALPYNKLDNEFHAKFGIFTDFDGHQVAFNGSYNDSITGTRNYEEIDIFCSWIEVQQDWVQRREDKFKRLWDNQDPNVRVFELPDAAREQILKLRNGQRPYEMPPSLKEASVSYSVTRMSGGPQVPKDIILREYQEEAITAWFDNQCRGLFEMATGTGKTITALAAATQLFNQTKRLIMVVACPYKHLVSQWSDEAQKFGFRPICVAEARTKWESTVTRQLQMFQRGQGQLITIITTNDALQSGVLPSILEPCWSEALLIADEAHYMGAPKMLTTLPGNAPYRLGLSATPIRHYDDDGTEKILTYFDQVVFRLPLDKAIGTHLTPYYYHAIPIEITEDEFETFRQLTQKLQRHMRSDDEELSEAAQLIAIQRARLLNNSVAKLDWVRDNVDNYAKIKHTLFYVGDKLFGEIRSVLGFEKRIRIHEFTQRQNNQERQEILARFEKGDLQALLAMKCLDEGVDVPPTRTAYFLASSGNPREFVQRRGRVLRRSPGKEFATLYDLIAIPPREYIDLGEQNADYNVVRAAFRREYRRVKEFAKLAQNHYQALDEMFEIASQLDLLDA
ncbi:MAG: DEAD/DEAH box helicase family protein [Chloroflexota bacterium]